MHLRFMTFCFLISHPSVADEGSEPNANQQAMYRALSVRDPVPSCETVESLSTAPLDDLLYIVDHATRPPWVAMRAAQCILRRHGPDAQHHITGWVGSEDTRGLALLTLSMLDQVPLELATPIAEAALMGPLADDARDRLSRAERPELRALVR